MKTSGKLTSHLWPLTALTLIKRDSHSCNVWFFITGHRSVFYRQWPGSACLLVDEVAEERPGLVASAQRHDAQPWPGAGRWPFFGGRQGCFETGDVQPVECWTISGWWYTVYLPLWKIWVRPLGWLFPIYGKIKNVPNHQPVYVGWRWLLKTWFWRQQKIIYLKHTGFPVRDFNYTSNMGKR